MRNICISVFLATLAGYASATCPALVRVMNTYNPNLPESLSLKIDGVDAVPSTSFCTTSDYVGFYPSETEETTFSIIGSNGSTIASRSFKANPGYSYSIAVTGESLGPPGQWMYSESPFVYVEDLTVPNPGRFKGTWYRLSETQLVIDYRVFTPENQEEDYVRLRDKENKIKIAFPELPFGTYSFTPVTVGSSSILVNTNYNPPISMGIFNETVNERVILDIFACGNSLLSPSGTPNTLRIFKKVNTPVVHHGCLSVQGVNILPPPNCKPGYVTSGLKCVPTPRTSSTLSFNPLVSFLFDGSLTESVTGLTNLLSSSISSSTFLPFSQPRNALSQGLQLLNSNNFTTSSAIPIPMSFSLEARFSLNKLGRFYDLFELKGNSNSFIFTIFPRGRAALFSRGRRRLTITPFRFASGGPFYLVISFQSNRVLVVLNDEVLCNHVIPSFAHDVYHLTLGNNFNGVIDEFNIFSDTMSISQAQNRDNSI